MSSQLVEDTKLFFFALLMNENLDQSHKYPQVWIDFFSVFLRFKFIFF